MVRYYEERPALGVHGFDGAEHSDTVHDEANEEWVIT